MRPYNTENSFGVENENNAGISHHSEQINELLNHKFIYVVFILRDICSGIGHDSLMWNLILLRRKQSSRGTFP